MKKAYTDAAEEVLGRPKSKKKPWISQGSWNLIDQREEINRRILSTKSDRIKNQQRKKYVEKDREVKRSIKSDKRKWMEHISSSAEEAARNQHMRTLYNLTKTICNERPRLSAAVLDKNGDLVNGKDEVQGRWTEHFKEILNRDEPPNPITQGEGDIIDGVLQEIKIDKPTRDEIRATVKRLQNKKSPGVDSITAELLKADVDFATERIHQLTCKVWRHEQIPRDWNRGLIIKLPKKGNLNECKNWRGITLLSIVAKILGKIIIDRIRDGVDCRLRKEQAGYRKGRGTTEQVFILRNIIEQVNEWQATLYLNFIDFEKAFDSIHRESMWIILSKYGIPEKIIRMVRVFYEDYECAVEDQGEICSWFRIKTGVKQGCNMSGFLFLIVMDWIMNRSVGQGENGIRWKFTSKLDDLDFADDIVLLSSTRQQLQNKTARIDREAKRVGLKTNVDKTKVMKINAKNQEGIDINGSNIDEAAEFTYLGAKVCKEGGGMKDLRNRIAKARGAFVRLKKIWKSKIFTTRTKLRIYKTLVVPVLLYSCETWKVNKGDNREIDVFQNKCLRRILGVKWQDKVNTQELLARAEMKPLSKEVMKRRWRMIGHILRKDKDSDEMIALTWAPEGKRRKGRPNWATWRRTVEKERKELGWNTWEETRAVAVNRDRWRSLTEALCTTRCEEDR